MRWLPPSFTVRRLMAAVAIVAAALGAYAYAVRPRPGPLQFRDTALAAQHRATSGREAWDGDVPPEVSLVELIADPGRHDGRPVRVAGFLCVEFEGTALYLSRDDADHLIARNGVWVAFGRGLVPWQARGLTPSQFHRKFVAIEGIFDPGQKGHRGRWPGSLREIWRVQELAHFEGD